MTPRPLRLATAALALVVACNHGSADRRPPNDGTDEPPTVYGGDRPVTLQLPPTITPGVSYPLVLVLHGYGATGALQQSYLQLTNLTADPGAFVLAPDGTLDGSGRRFWNAGACCDFGGSGVDDVAYLGGLVDAVSADWPIDPARVYVVGHSNGAFMAYRLACDRADVVAAIAGLAGATPTAACDPVRPVSVLHVHGTADATIAYDGGALFGIAYPGAQASAAAWAAHDGCAATWTAGDPVDLVSTLAGAETTVERADACPTGIGVELWSIGGGSHIPSFNAGFGAAVVDWLSAHPRP